MQHLYFKNVHALWASNYLELKAAIKKQKCRARRGGLVLSLNAHVGAIEASAGTVSATPGTHPGTSSSLRCWASGPASC